MKKQAGMTVIELVISVAIVGIIISMIIGTLSGCRADHEKAVKAANEYKANIPGATGVSCVATDSDKDGYCSCTIFRGESDPLAVECGCQSWCWINCTAGCKAAIPKFRSK